MSRRLWIKLYRDLTATWGRTMMMTSAIAVSLIVFGTMLFAYAIEQSNATAGYLSTNPASARITLHPEVEPEDYESITQIAKNTPGVLDASLRTVTSVKLPVEGDKTEPLVLYVARAGDPLNISKFDIKDSSWPPGAGEIFLERASLESLSKKVGDKLMVIGFDGIRRELKITGEVHDQSLALAGTEGGVGYATDKTLEFLGKEAGLDQVAITIGQTKSSMNRQEIIPVAQAVARNVAQVSGADVEEIAVPPPNKHPHQSVADAVLTGLLIFGSLALVLSSVLMAVMFNALLTQQIPQIGILKSIGAETSHVLRFYLSMVLLIASSATLVAVLPALVLGRVLAQMILEGAMNIDVGALSVSGTIYLIYFLAGIGLPIIIALVPLVRFSRKTVREALDHHGTVRNHGSLIQSFFTVLGKIRGIDRMLLMAFRNMLRRRGRTVLSLSLLAVAGAIFIGGMNVKDGFSAIPVTVYDSNKWDVQIVLKEPTEVDKVQQIASKVKNVDATETWFVGETSLETPGESTVTQTYPDEGHGKARLSAIPAASTLFEPPEMIEGRWLVAHETGVVVLPASARQTLPDVKAGDKITLPLGEKKAELKVAGIAKELAGGSCPCITQAGLAAGFGISGGNSLRVSTTTHDKKSREDTTKALSVSLSDSGIPTSGAVTIDGLVESTEGHSDILVQLILLIAGAIGVVGLIGLNSMMSTSVVERTRELGILKSIGAPAGAIMRLVMYEGILIALVSFAIAIIPAFVLSSFVGAELGNMFFNAPIPYASSWQTFAIWTSILLIGTTLATLTPAYRAAKITIREAIAYL